MVKTRASARAGSATVRPAVTTPTAFDTNNVAPTPLPAVVTRHSPPANISAAKVKKPASKKGGSTAKKRTPRACTTCRRQKAKCDGEHPICGSCAVKERLCGWDRDQTQQQQPPPQHQQQPQDVGEEGEERALRARIAELERAATKKEEREDNAFRVMRRMAMTLGGVRRLRRGIRGSEGWKMFLESLEAGDFVARDDLECVE